MNHDKNSKPVPPLICGFIPLSCKYPGSYSGTKQEVVLMSLQLTTKMYPERQPQKREGAEGGRSTSNWIISSKLSLFPQVLQSNDLILISSNTSLQEPICYKQKTCEFCKELLTEINTQTKAQPGRNHI